MFLITFKIFFLSIFVKSGNIDGTASNFRPASSCTAVKHARMNLKIDPRRQMIVLNYTKNSTKFPVT